MCVRECEGRGLYLNSGLQVWQQALSQFHSPSDIIFFLNQVTFCIWVPF